MHRLLVSGRSGAGKSGSQQGRARRISLYEPVRLPRPRRAEGISAFARPPSPLMTDALIRP
ncbi:hypothetical protein HMPREF1979_03343 [Actinomyces johnsonii F0542]|uniref:Uncharacterized protein n=1 Tax=Actinomyces johnsonii F0542 TaxID=1321818 RepID=U1RL80_9ACTO|nr:hypothetical protein HMPREF1979_03343 [Actinomyces johnsonii F0542]